MAPNLIPASGNGKPKLLDQVREVLRVKHYSVRIEDAYADWINRFSGSKPAAKPRRSREGRSFQKIDTAKRGGC
jgi:hypothetical protein